MGLVGITFGSFQILNSIGIYLFIGVGLSLIGLFVFVETNVIKPMMDLSLFKIRYFLGGKTLSINASLKDTFYNPYG